MSDLFRWTTPSFDIEFDDDLDVADVTEAILAIKQWGNTVIEKDLSTATVDTENNIITWVLTQSETGLITKAKKCEVQCDCLLQNGMRTTTEPVTYSVQDSAKNEVITHE